jgi:hypothetical protein
LPCSVFGYEVRMRVRPRECYTVKVGRREA